MKKLFITYITKVHGLTISNEYDCFLRLWHQLLEIYRKLCKKVYFFLKYHLFYQDISLLNYYAM